MKNKFVWLLVAAVAVVVLVLLVGRGCLANKAGSEGETKRIHPRRDDIQTVVSTTGTVLPKNRLAVQPPVNGRIEQVLVKEGQKVKAGDILAVMSSTDRAALLDAARGQGEEALKRWQDVYKPIPLSAPIDGEVIVSAVQPGQAVTTGDAVIVLSDRLIIRAQVDETDVGKARVGQKAVAGIDAYPDVKIPAVVDHIYYESKTVNNVTVYLVDLLPEGVPAFIRSGMNANVDLIQEEKAQVLTLPLAAVQKDSDGTSFVMVPAGTGKPVRRTVAVGISDDKRIEIVSGLSEEDEVVTKANKYSLPKKSGTGTNPFMPTRPGGSGGNRQALRP